MRAAWGTLIFVVSLGAPKVLPEPDYEAAIARAKTSQGADMRHVLSQCAANLYAMKEQRALVWSELERHGYLKPNGSLLLEVVGSYWLDYGYAVVSNGWSIRGLLEDPPNPRQAAVRVPRSLLRGLEGYADWPVPDGACYFVTVRDRGRFVQVAVYQAAPESTPVARLLSVLAPLIDRRPRMTREEYESRFGVPGDSLGGDHAADPP